MHLPVFSHKAKFAHLQCQYLRTHVEEAKEMRRDLVASLQVETQCIVLLGDPVAVSMVTWLHKVPTMWTGRCSFSMVAVQIHLNGNKQIEERGSSQRF